MMILQIGMQMLLLSNSNSIFVKQVLSYLMQLLILSGEKTNELMLLKESEERWRVRGEMDEWWCWMERYASVGRLSRMYLSSTPHHSTHPLRIISIFSTTKNHIFFTLGLIFTALDFCTIILFCLLRCLSLVEDPKPENKTQAFSFTPDFIFISVSPGLKTLKCVKHYWPLSYKTPPPPSTVQSILIQLNLKTHKQLHQHTDC